MRRKEREVIDVQKKLEIMNQCKICRIAIYNPGTQQPPYVIPLNFGYCFEQGRLVLYFHGAFAGRKYEMISQGVLCGFEMDCDTGIIEGASACAYSYYYSSLVGSGKLELVQEKQEKKEGLAFIVSHQTGKEFNFENKMLEGVAVYRLEVDEITGKTSSLC